MKKIGLVLLWQVTFVVFALVLGSCTTTKPVPKTPAGEISYKIITHSTYQYLDAAYIGSNDKVMRQANIGKNEVVFPIGTVQHGFISSISCTGYNAKKGKGSIELQILHNGLMVEHKIVDGQNPSLAISYRVD